MNIWGFLCKNISHLYFGNHWNLEKTVDFHHLPPIFLESLELGKKTMDVGRPHVRTQPLKMLIIGLVLFPWSQSEMPHDAWILNTEVSSYGGTRNHPKLLIVQRENLKGLGSPYLRKPPDVFHFYRLNHVQSWYLLVNTTFLCRISSPLNNQQSRSFLWLVHPDLEKVQLAYSAENKGLSCMAQEIVYSVFPHLWPWTVINGIIEI